jgi:hypothetical protein
LAVGEEIAVWLNAQVHKWHRVELTLAYNVDSAIKYPFCLSKSIAISLKKTYPQKHEKNKCD